MRQSLAETGCAWQAENEGEEAEIFMSASIGVAISPFHGSTETTLLAAADSAMYRSKQSGRNRVTIADAPVQEHEMPTTYHPQNDRAASPTLEFSRDGAPVL